METTEIKESRRELGQENTQDNKKKDYDAMCKEIVLFCEVPRSTSEIKQYLGYKSRKSATKIINALLDSGELEMTIPNKPTSGDQKYVAKIK